MNSEELRNYCLSKKGTVEDYPFDEKTQCFKVCGKIFAITAFEYPLSVNLKCDPELAADLRERHAEVTPGYHMSKRHWNTVLTEGSLSERDLKKMIDHSYELVVNKLSRKLKEELIK